MSKIFDALQKASGDEPEKRGESDDRTQPRAVKETDPPPSYSAPMTTSVPLANLEEVPEIEEDFARELAHLRASIDLAFPDDAPRTILFAAALPGEGSTTVAARYAQMLAQDPRLGVLLADLDFRNRDDRVMDLADHGHGTASVLGGALGIEDGLRPTPLPRLHVLPSEGVTSAAYELCDPDRVAPFLAAMKQRYAMSILDAAPVLAAPETALLAGQADGVVLVVRAGRTKRQIVQRALEQLRKYEPRILGVVMNRQQYAIPDFIYRRL